MGKIKQIQWLGFILTTLVLFFAGAGGCGGDHSPPAINEGTRAEQDAALLSTRILEFLTLSTSQEFSSSSVSTLPSGLASAQKIKEETSSNYCPSESLSPLTCPRGGDISVKSNTCNSEEDSSLSICGTIQFSDCQDLFTAGCPIFAGPVEFCLSLSDSNSSLLFFTPDSQNFIQTNSCEGAYNFQVQVHASCNFPVKPFANTPVEQQCAGYHLTFKNEVGCLQCREGKCVQDIDCDDVADRVDNCPNDVNPRQSDSDQNGIGDICEPFLPGGIDCSSLACESTEQCHQAVRFCPGAEEELGQLPNCCDGTCGVITGEAPLCPLGTCPDFAPVHCQSNSDCGENELCFTGCCTPDPGGLPNCACECAPGDEKCILCPPDEPSCAPCSCTCSDTSCNACPVDDPKCKPCAPGDPSCGTTPTIPGP